MIAEVKSLLLSSWWRLDFFLVTPLRRLVWNHGLLYFWRFLWLRHDEFHPSLDLDIEAMLGMNEKRRLAYRRKIARRRQKAHMRTL